MSVQKTVDRYRTTFLRYILALNADNLRKQGIIFLEEFKEVPRLKEESIPSDLIARFQKNLHQVTAPTSQDPSISYVMSSPHFTGHYISGLTETHTIAPRVREIFQGFDVKIILYLRRQDELMESIYTQMFHEGRADDFEQFVSDFGHKCFRWDTVLDAYEQQFGKDNIIPRRYHEKFFPERNSLIQDFCDIINASDLIIKTPSRQVNAGFSRDAMEIARICNPHLTQQEHGRLRAYLQSVSPKKPMERYHYFNAETRQRYMESFEKSNSEVAMRFFPDSRGILFPPPEDDTHVDYPGLSMESVCRTFMLCLLELDRAFAGQQSFTGTKLRKIENKLYNTICKYPKLKNLIKKTLGIR